jgi:hypothetical protein
MRRDVRHKGGPATPLERLVPLLQGSYYLTTGLWALLHMRSFERVTGRKAEHWLVRTVGVLAAAIGLTLLQGARRRRPVREIRSLSRLSALAFVLAETPVAARGRISRIYLADAALQTAFLLGSAVAGGLRESPAERPERPVAAEARQRQAS